MDEHASRRRRATALSRSPRPVGELVEMAQLIGIDPFSQHHIMWIASAAACDMKAPVPPECE